MFGGESYFFNENGLDHSIKNNVRNLETVR